MTDTSKEAVDMLCEELAKVKWGPSVNGYQATPLVCTIAQPILRQLLTERDAEKARADEATSDYLRRHKDACDRYMEVVDLRAQLTAANEKLASARELFEAAEAIAEYRWPADNERTERDDVEINGLLDNLRSALATHPTTPASHEGQRDLSVPLEWAERKAEEIGTDECAAGMLAADPFNTAKESQS